MTLNSYIYGQPDLVERLTQEQRRIVEEYRNRAAGHIMEFDGAFAGSGTGRTKCQARL
jgi:hypothetical protein